MRTYDTSPDLTESEASRLWMTAVEVCRVAAVGDPARDKAVRRTLSELTARGHLPAVKKGPGKTQPNFYSLKSAVMLRVYAEMVGTGRTYVYAQPVAEKVAELLVEAVKQVPDVTELEARIWPWRVCYGGMTSKGTPSCVRLFRGPLGFDELDPLDMGVFAAGYTVARTIETFVDFWASKR